MTHFPTSPRSVAEYHGDEAFPLLPAQYAELCRGSEPVQPERRLMLAVLSDAIVLFQTGGSQLARHHDVADAHRWILSDDRRWPYSFVNVCEALEIAPSALRRQLVRWRAAQAARRRNRGAARRSLLKTRRGPRVASAVGAPVAAAAVVPAAVEVVAPPASAYQEGQRRAPDRE